MSIHKWRPSLVKQACEAALESPIFEDRGTNEEFDREFREFIESISMPAEELAAIVGRAESSTAEAKKSLRYVKIATAKAESIAFGTRGARRGGGVGDPWGLCRPQSRLALPERQPAEQS